MSERITPFVQKVHTVKLPPMQQLDSTPIKKSSELAIAKADKDLLSRYQMLRDEVDQLFEENPPSDWQEPQPIIGQGSFSKVYEA